MVAEHEILRQNCIQDKVDQFSEWADLSNGTGGGIDNENAT